MRIDKKAQVVVFGKKWFDRVNGNTYHSSQVFVDGNEVGYDEFAYGYGNQFEYTALDILKRKYSNLEKITALWKIKEMGIVLSIFCSDVTAKKYL